MVDNHDTAGLAQDIQTSIDAIIGTSLDCVITSWNDGAADLYGYSAEEVLGQHISVIAPPDRKLEQQEIFDRVKKGEHVRGFSTERIRKDGAQIAVLLTVAPIVGDGDTLIGTSVVAHDVTEQRPADAKFRALLEAAPDAIVIAGTDGCILLVNRQAEEIFGYTRDELLGKPVEHLIPERMRPDHGSHRGRFFMDPQVRPMGVGLELFGRRKDGSEFPVEISLSPIATEDGLLVSAAVRDVTDRKRSEEKFRKFLEFAPDAIVMTDRAGRIVELNSQAFQLFGYERQELVGQAIEVLLPERFHGRHPEHRTEYFSSAQVRPMGAGLDLYGRRKDGTEFPVDISLAPLETEEGVLVSAAIRDVSERKRAEEQSRRLEQMRQRRRQALELNDEVVQGLTVAQMAHYLKRPEDTEKAIERTLRAARAIVSQMLQEEKGSDEPEAFVRERPARVLQDDPEE